MKEGLRKLFGRPVIFTKDFPVEQKPMVLVDFNSWVREQAKIQLPKVLRAIGIVTCEANLVVPYSDLKNLGSEFAKFDKVKHAVSAVASGVSRTDTKQFLVKYGERNDLLISQFSKLQPIIDKACGEGMQPYHCDMWYVIPTDRPREWSQNWHRDRDGSTVVKVFCYFTDVTEESGPLEYVVGSHAGKYSDIVTPERSYATADEAERIKPEDVATLTVPAGTLAFVNTTGLHRGGYAKSQPRLCAVWTFVSGK